MKDTPDIDQILSAEAERFEREKDKPPKGPFGRPRVPDAQRGQVYSLRIPLGRLNDLQRLAAAKGEQPSALMRSWVLERLDREVGIGLQKSRTKG